MTVEPSYVPRGSKLRWKSFLFIFIACCLIAYGGQWLLNQRQKKTSRYLWCLRIEQSENTAAV